jgi:hypothetical protein
MALLPITLEQFEIFWMRPFWNGLVVVEWPARSPDMTPPDFFLWGYLKDRVFARSPRDIPELKEIIKEEFDTIPQDMIQKAYRSVLNRCQVCIEIDGKQIKLHRG